MVSKTLLTEFSYLKDLKNDELENYPDYSETPRTEPIERESDSFQRKFFNMLFILGLLIGFMILASWALKRMMKAKITNLNTSNTIKVLETRYLSPRATLYLIEIQNKNFLIAESPTNVTYLASIPSLGEAEETSASPSVRPRPFFNES